MRDAIILRTTDGGVTWKSITRSGGGALRYCDLYAVSLTDANTGIAVSSSDDLGYPGIILRTTDGGATWTEQFANGPRQIGAWLGLDFTGVDLISVSFSDANTGTVVGSGGTILRTTDGGVTWTKQSSGTTNDLWGVFFTDANTGTVVGSDGTILRTTAGGK